MRIIEELRGGTQSVSIILNITFCNRYFPLSLRLPSRNCPTTSYGPRAAVVKRSVMDRIIDTIEAIAALFVGLVAADIFISVILRRFFSTQIPDAYDFGSMLLGILIFWGIAATSYRGGHITVDLVWAQVGPRWKRAIDVFATLVLLFVVTVQTYTLFDKVRATYNDHVLTFDLGLPTWPFFAVAWVGDVSAVVLIAIRTYRLIFHPEDIHDTGRAREPRRRRRPGLRRAVRADAAARAGRHGDGPGRRHRLRLPERRRAGAEAGRPDLDAHRHQLPVRRHPDVPADGRVRLALGHQPRAVPCRQHLRRPPARRAGARDHRLVRRLCRDLGLVGRHRRDLLRGRLSRDAPLRLSAELRHRRDRRRRHAGRHAAAVDRARGLRADHPAGCRQAVPGRHPARPARHDDVHADHRRDRARAAELPADGARRPRGTSAWPGCAMCGRRCCCSCW